MTKGRLEQLKRALDSGDAAGYLDGFEIGDEDDSELRSVQLERREIKELLSIMEQTGMYDR